MNHILIESLSAAAAARAAGFQGPIHWHTSSPGVIEALRASGESADWIEDCVERDLCEKVARVTGQAVEMLAQEFSPAAIDLDIPCMMANAARQIYLLAGTLLYKQALLSPWMKKYPTGVVVGDPHLTANENGNIGCHRFDTLFACLAAHPANGLRVIVHRAARPKLSEFKDVPSALTRLLSWADLSFDQLLWRGLRYIARGRRLGLRTDVRVIVMRDNEIIREILPHVMFKGASIEILPPPAQVSPGDPHPLVPSKVRLDRRLAAASELGIASEPVSAALHQLITEASRWWKPVAAQAAAWADKLNIDRRPTVLISNAVPGFAAAALLSALRTRGGRIVVAEHGVSAGLTAFHLAFRRWNEAQFSDAYLVCSENTRNFVHAESKLQTVDVRSVGLADSVRAVRLRSVQRWLSRWKQGIGRDRVVLYLARPEQNNFRWLPYSSHDRDLYELQKSVVYSVLPRVRGRGVFKTYPTQRFLDPMPIGVQSPLPNDVELIDRGDFRFVRAIADVIIVESLMSTIGLAFGAGVPIVFLRQRGIDPLPAVESHLMDAAFFVDTRERGWEDRLVEFLNQPDETLWRAWRAKAPTREAFVGQYINGPEHPGRNGARAVIETARLAAAGG